MNEWVNEWLDDWTHELMNGIQEWEKQKIEGMNDWMNVWTNNWMNERIWLLKNSLIKKKNINMLKKRRSINNFSN